MRRVVTQEKLTQSNRKHVSRKRVRGHFFERVKEHRVSEHENRRQQFAGWNGWCSPSAYGFTLNMCMVEFFKSMETFRPADEDGLELMAAGTINHTGLARDTKYIEGLHFAAPTFPTQELRDWYKRIAPEIPVVCPVTGMRMKADYVLNVNGTPAPFDYKCNFPDSAEDWAQFVEDKLPKIENFTQVGMYADRMDALGYFDVPIEMFGLGHHNGCAKPNRRRSKLEYWWHYDEEMRWYFRNFAYCFAVYRAMAMDGKLPRRCDYDYCKQHGNDKEIWSLMAYKRLELK